MFFRMCLILFPLFLVCSFEMASLRSVTCFNSLPSFQKQQTQAVPFCELLANSEKYDQKIISTEAILIIYTQPQVDGGESFFYDQSCDKQDLYALASDTGTSPSSDPSIVTLLDKIVEKAQKNKKVARAKVTFTGQFLVAKAPQEGFGHLSWAKFKIARFQLSEVKEVPQSTPWPVSFRVKH